MTGRVSLAQQIALLSETAPTDFDPEELNPTTAHSDDEGQGSRIAGREHYVDVGLSTLRSINQSSVSDPKYEGRRISRKELMDDRDEHIGAGDEDAEGEDLPEESVSQVESIEGEGDADGVDDGVGSFAPSRVPAREATPEGTDIEEPLRRTSPKRSLEEPQADSESQDIASALRATREQDRKKGKAVAAQISLWDALLDARIRLQKAATAVNRLSLDEMPQRSSQPSVQEALHNMFDEAIALSEDLFTLQDSLLNADGTTARPQKRAKLMHEGDRNYSKELTELSGVASEYEAAYHPYLVQTLSKWSAKVQAVAPNVLLPANRGSFKNSMNGRSGMPNVVDVIDETLRSDAQKLLARTRHSRSHAQDGADDGSGNEDDAEMAALEMFDDADFYQQLLRDVIEARGGANGEEGEQEWMRRQKALKVKRKKTIDTRASKGRKLRYQVHEKLQNFMVPIPAQRGAWHDEQIDELFSSLLSSGL